LLLFVGFWADVDHAETRETDAVRTAKAPEDLLSVIDSEGMQLLTTRENRLQIEALQKRPVSISTMPKRRSICCAAGARARRN